MKLYAWQPTGYGETSFFVMAESEDEARRKVELLIARDRVFSRDPGGISARGWGTDYYKLTVAEPGEVLTNENS